MISLKYVILLSLGNELKEDVEVTVLNQNVLLISSELLRGPVKKSHPLTRCVRLTYFFQRLIT